ncbi:hypothetical protein OJAV_G00143100 [Oryzias javanicus]|uniref:Immunoglobulin V-set domain-containing protein n=1 Tax=Oryzias javanicus TaxID=123683 RepID=A0A3S2PXW4_ORYJA|nr:hypothetical protein OJAV_G00143100 [Oryzias javanicus]
MILITLITAALLKGSFVKGFTECSFYKSRETSCFAEAGKSLNFHLFDKDYGGIKELKHDRTIILKRDKTGNVTVNLPNISSAFYFKNGTIQLKNVSKKNDGVYTLEEFNSKGEKLRSSNVRLKVLGVSAVFVTRTEDSHLFV